MNKFKSIVEDKGIYKHVLKEGYGDKISTGSIIKYNYKGTTGNLNNKNIEFSNNYSLIKYKDFKGWDIMLHTMKKGEVSLFVIRYDYGFGRIGYEDIPPYTDLIYYVHIIDVKN